MLKPESAPDNNGANPRLVLGAVEELVKGRIHGTVIKRFKTDGEGDPANPANYDLLFGGIAGMGERARKNGTIARHVRNRKR